MGFPKLVKIAVLGIKQKVNTEGNRTVEEMVQHPRDVKLAETIANALGLSYEIVISEDGQYGRRLQNGSWTGMLGMVQKGEADMVISVLSITEERSETFLFSYPFFTSEITFLTRKPNYLPQMDVFLHPFSIGVWLAMIACICIVPFVFRLLVGKRYSLSTLLMSTIRMLLGKSINQLPKKPEEYLPMAFWFLGSAFVSYIYSAVLLSFLSFPTLDGIRTIKDLAEGISRGEYWCTSFPGSYFAPVLLRSSDRSMHIIARSLEDSAESTDFVSVLENFKDGSKKPVFLGALDPSKPYKHFYFVSEDVFFTALSAVATRKDFCCKSELDEVISRFWASGIIRKILSDSYYKGFLKNLWRITHENEKSSSGSKLNISMFMGPFVFLITSHSLSLCVLLIEIYIGRFQRSR